MHDLIGILDALPQDLTVRSGSVFYSGQAAFTGTPPLYILGLNPGGNPVAQGAETIERDIKEWPERPYRWSRYLDESWRGDAPGTHGMQPRLAHLLRNLDLDPREIPASNVVFVRTASEAHLKREVTTLLPACWTFHRAVIASLGIRTVLCLGGTAGKWARQMLGAETPLGHWSERNGRGWKGTGYLARDGKAVITLPHPGRADWRNPLADPSEFVRGILQRDMRN